MKTTFFNVLTAGCLGLSTLALADSYPLQVTDDRNVTTTLTQPPQRVASISIFAADLMTKLKVPVVALSTRNNKMPVYLNAQLDQVTDLGAAHETNLERLTQAKPDLTIGIKTYTLPVASKIEEVSPFLAYDFNTWADSDRAIKESSRAVNRTLEGQQLNQQFRKLSAEMAAKVANKPSPSALLLWIWADTPVAFYADMHLTPELMSKLNITNVMGLSKQGLMSDVISMEKLLQLDPDHILLFQGDEADLPYHPVWEQLSAYKNGKITRVSDQFVEPHGPIAREWVLKEIAHLFYPQQFSAPTNIPAEARAKPARWAAAN